MFRWAFSFGLLLLFADVASADPATQIAYDPLAVPADHKPETLDLTVKDAKRDREIPIRVFLPAAKTPAPVVLFSHGLGGSRENNPYLGKHWSARGYLVVFMQHVGSDESVWKETAALERIVALKQAANLKNTLLRFADVPAVIDQLAAWNDSKDSPLAGRLDLARLGMTGHSFGAVTTQGVSGQRTPRGVALFTEKRIKAALPMSPSSPRGGGDLKQSFGGVSIPWLLMTGTKDTSPISDADVESRLAVFPALLPGDKYELVLDGAEHMAFGERDLPGANSRRNPNHHKAILAISTAFWDTYLRDDKSAKAWLTGDAVLGVLEEKDRWQKK